MMRLIAILLTLTLSASGAVAQKRKPRRAKAPQTPSEERIEVLKGLAEPSYDFDDPKFAAARADVWVPVAAGDYERYYFNRAKAARTGEGTLKFWIKEAAKDDWHRWAVDLFYRRQQEGLDVGGHKYDGIDHVLILYEVACARRQFRLLSRVDYSREGKILSSITKRGDVEWDDIIPESIGEAYYEAACGP